MGRLKRFAHICKILGVLALLTLPTPAVAQYLGTVGQASTVSTFSVTPGSSPALVPPCDATHTPPNCIKMIGQVSHLVTVSYKGAGANPCGIFLDGSADGVQWITLASWYFGGGGAPITLMANGYYPLIRLNVNPTSINCNEPMTGTYAGFQAPLPLSNLSRNYMSSSVAAPVKPALDAPLYPFIVESVQCYNPNNYTAWLDLFDTALPAVLGGGYFYEIPIPANSLFIYPPVAALLGLNNFWAGAATASGGSSAVAAPLECGFQMNYWGPFAPLNPLSP